MNSSLCDSFQELAALTWSRIESAEKTNLAWSEETNTETVLLELHERHPSEVKILSFTKAKEARNGADWEWWIGAPGRWLGMRVQAKRIRVPYEDFGRLQTYKARGQPKSQIDTLIEAAIRDQLNAAYCLYTFLPRPFSIPNFPNDPSAIPRARVYGCLVGHALAIRNASVSGLAELAPVLFPWHLLVCPDQTSIRSTKTADRAYEVVRRSAGLLARPLDLSSDVLDVDESDTESDVPDRSLFPPVEKLPDHMNLLRDAGQVYSDLVVRNVAEQSKAIARHIRGLVLIDTSGA